MIAKSTGNFMGSFKISGSTRLIPGPVWNSFEDFRKIGSAGLEAIPQHGVAVLNCKAGSYRIIRDSDFQYLVGLATDVARLQGGLKVVVQAARIALQHPDEEHMRMLAVSAALIAECPELPQREGHEHIRLTPNELAESAASNDDFDVTTAEIPRPSW